MGEIILMGYQDELSGDRGLLRGEVDYDEFDELANQDVDYLQEIGAVMAPATTSGSTTGSARLTTSRMTYGTPTMMAPKIATAPTSQCPTGEQYDGIEQMCVPVPTSTGTSLTTLRAKLLTPVMSTTRLATVMAPVTAVPPRIVSSHGTTPPIDYLIDGGPPQSPLPSSSSKWKASGRATTGQEVFKNQQRFVPPEMLVMPAPPPSSANGGGLSTNTKIALGVGAGALLLYIVTRK
jgi:hypothetical protein